MTDLVILAADARLKAEYDGSGDFGRAANLNLRRRAEIIAPFVRAHAQLLPK
jgi:hypothetical protein